MKDKFTALVDLDAMLHIIANVQWSAGNHDDTEAVIAHVQRFIQHILSNANAHSALMFYQDLGHENFRNDIMPRYKEHRSTSDAVAHWKPTILTAFHNAGAIGLKYIESDDAIGIMSTILGYQNIVIITSDKDMKQVPGTFYNPFKSNITAEERWYTMTPDQSERFLYHQILTGDPTDMPGELCGIEKCGPKTADKLLDHSDSYGEILERAYTSKYGESGWERCKLTYKMVKILNDAEPYVGTNAETEIKYLKTEYQNLFVPVTDPVANLFESPENNSIDNLFNG